MSWRIITNSTPVLAQVAETEYHVLGGLNNMTLFFTPLKTRKSKIKVLIILFPQ